MSDRNVAVVEKMIEEIILADSFIKDTDLGSFLNDEQLKRARAFTIE